MAGWWYLANWDFRRAYVVKRARLMPEAQATAQLVSRFGYSAGEAHSLYERAASLKSEADEEAFITRGNNNIKSAWLQCRNDGALKLGAVN